MSTAGHDLTCANDNTGAGSCGAEEAYHTDFDSGDSHSSLELFRESPAKYAAIRVHRKMAPDPPTASMNVGAALHALMFEFDKPCEFGPRQTKHAGTRSKFWDGPLEEIRWKSELSDKEMSLVWSMWCALLAEKDAASLLVVQPGWNERIFTAILRGLRARVKCKPDRLLENGLVVDLKTVDGAVDPSSWSRTLAKWGYHRQAAFYLDVLALAGQKADKFVFVAISKQPPHEIGIYVVDEDSVDQGRRENRELLQRLAECRRTSIWKHDWQGKVLTVGVPRWAKD